MFLFIIESIIAVVSAFEFVHSDVWGPYCLPSVKDFRYFIVFVNDSSRMTWLYLLKERSKVFGVIELFSMK